MTRARLPYTRKPCGTGNIRSRRKHGPPEAEKYLATCSKGLIQAAYGMGMNVGLIADAILEDRALDGIRPLRAIVNLKSRYPVQDIDLVSARLMRFGISGYTSVKTEIKREIELARSPQPFFRFAPPVKRRTTRRRSMAYLAALKPKLTRLKLSGMLDSLQLRSDQTVQERWSFSDFLERLLQDEVE